MKKHFCGAHCQHRNHGFNDLTWMMFGGLFQIPRQRWYRSNWYPLCIVRATKNTTSEILRLFEKISLMKPMEKKM